MKKMTRKGIPFHITRSFLTDSLCVLMGTAVLAFSIRAVFDPMSMVTGGFSGIAILASFISGGRIPLWLTNLVLNAPLFLIAWQQKEWGLLRQSILGAAALTVWLKVIPEIPFISGDWFLASVCGGVIMGVSMFLILRVGATSGGTDMLAMLLHRKLLAGISVARILQWIDAVIVVSGVLLVGWKPTLYAVIAIVISAWVTAHLLMGHHFAKAVLVVSEHAGDIAKQVMAEMDRGVTGLQGQGMYTGSDRLVLLCVVDRRQIVALKSLVFARDPAAFMIVMDAAEVFGEGFLQERH